MRKIALFIAMLFFSGAIFPLPASAIDHPGSCGAAAIMVANDAHTMWIAPQSKEWYKNAVEGIGPKMELFELMNCNAALLKDEFEFNLRAQRLEASHHDFYEKTKKARENEEEQENQEEEE